MFIVATISKNSYTEEKIEEILKAGATVLRYNFSHGNPREMFDRVSKAKRVIAKLKLTKKVKILADLPGDKIRMGSFEGSEYHVRVGQRVTFKSASHSNNPDEYIPVDHPQIGTLVEIGQQISIADGELGLEVVEIINSETVKTRALKTRFIPQLKGFNIGRRIDDLDHITQKTIDHIKHLSRLRPEWVAFTFVNSANYLKQAKKLLKSYSKDTDWKPKVVSKLETPLAVENIEEIVKATDIVLVARGDLGLTYPIEKLGIAQKLIVKVAKRYKRKVIVSTQILDSLLEYHVPSRAEVLDLTNIVLDGADGIMLAKETGISLTPGYSVAMARKIITAVERSGNTNQHEGNRK